VDLSAYANSRVEVTGSVTLEEWTRWATPANAARERADAKVPAAPTLTVTNVRVLSAACQ